MSFLAELKRRNVFRVGLFYVVSAWLIIEVAETVLPLFDVPDGVLRGLVVLLIIGLVPALGLSWIYEITPEGIKRDADMSAADLKSPDSGRKLNWATLVVAVVAIGFMAMDRMRPAPPSIVTPESSASPATSAAGTEALDASIAVLPFADLSQAGDQGYFSDGMAEEILNVLARVKGLQVASRTSAFAFKGQENLGIPAIANQLSVRHVLEGSVRRAGRTIRITAQLIDAQTDRHLWSETFDRPLTAENVFAIQDEIAQAIVAALVAALPSADVGAVGATATTTSLGAYDNYLRARALVRSRRQLLLADELLEKSLQQDAQYAPAWELRAGLQTLLGEYTDTQVDAEELDRRGTEYADRALMLAPDSALALAVKANLRSLAARRLHGRHDLAAVIADFERSLQLEPSNPDALNWSGLTWMTVGRPDKALAAFQRCVQIDPQASACSENEYDTLYTLGRYDEAWQRYLATLDRGAITDQWTNFSLLTRYEQQAAFMFASNQSRFLPRWHRHEALYQAHRNLDGDHGDLVREILAFAGAEGIDTENGYVVLLLLPLGVYDLRPFPMLTWSQEHRRYRQSPQFKRYIRESGVLDYWRKAGFPVTCHPVEPDDFHCD